MKTHRIENPRNSLLLGEHADSAFISSCVDGASIGGFYSAEQCMEAGLILFRMGRRIRKRAASQPNARP